MPQYADTQMRCFPGRQIVPDHDASYGARDINNFIDALASDEVIEEIDLDEVLELYRIERR
jgi:hypothetical protein